MSAALTFECGIIHCCIAEGDHRHTTHQSEEVDDLPDLFLPTGTWLECRATAGAAWELGLGTARFVKGSIHKAFEMRVNLTQEG